MLTLDAERDANVSVASRARSEEIGLSLRLDLLQVTAAQARYCAAAEIEIVQLPRTKWMRLVWEAEEYEPSFRRHHRQIHHAKPSEMIGYLIPDANTTLVMGKRLAHRNFCILKKQNNLNFPTSHLRPKPVSQYGRL